MNREPRAASLLAEGLSRTADGIGIVLLVLLGWRMFFAFDTALQERALLVGLIGMLACWLDRASLKNAPPAMLAWVGLSLLSAAVHRWATISSSADPAWLALFTPASHLVVMAAFVYGTAYVLRTPARLSWFVILMVIAVAVLSVQIAFDRAASGFVYVRGGPSLPSVPQWGGIHGTSLLLTLCLPLACAAILTGRSVWRATAVAILAGGFLIVAYLNGSRGGQVSMGLVAGAMAIFFVVNRTSRRQRALLLGGGVVGLAIGLAATVWFMRSYMDHGEDLSGRTFMWEAAARLMLDHPVLGVGPGNYQQAILASGYASDFPSYYVGLHNAHNMVLHVGVEVGVAGALCLLWFLAWAMRACWRAWAGGDMTMVPLGVLFALVGFLAHSASENFLDARVEVERTRLVVWMVLAAALALERLPRSSQATKT